MTQTECMDCTWAENCEWELIVQNMVPMSPICVAKQWHDKSLKVFAEQTEAVRARIVTVGDFCEASKPWPVRKGEVKGNSWDVTNGGWDAEAHTEDYQGA